MSTYEYTVIDKHNSVYRGQVIAWNKRQATKQLGKDGQSIVTLVKVTTSSKWWQFIFRRVARIDRILFLRNLMTMLRAGLNLPEALSSSREQSGNPQLREMITEAEQAVTSGRTLSSAIANYPDIFTPVSVAMIRIGERCGKLVDIFDYLVKQQESDYQLSRKIRNAMLYPALIVATMLGIIVVMMIFVIPKIADIYSEANATLPFFTSALIAVSHFIASQGGIYLAASLILVIILFQWGLRNLVGFKKLTHRLLLNFPLVSPVIKKFNLAIVSRSLSMLSHAGFSIDESLVLVSQAAGNMYYQSALLNGVHFVKRGVQLSDIFHDKPNLFLPLFNKMVRTGEETGSLSDMFDHIASYYDDDIQHWTANLSTMIEPALLLGTGVVVGGVAFSIIFPLWNFANIL